ncbi:MAG: 3-dehydroquinate synthase [Oscillospiraceae bacterium]|jgi:3-dehydroquinate synthase|nr:3-dehydroquinate synthase [Oscillospiraceae bacterium]
MKKLKLKLGERSYNIIIESGVLDRIGLEVSGIFPGKRVCVVSDGNVAALYLSRVKNSLASAGLEVSSAVIPPGEQSKSINSLPTLYNAFLDAKLSRSDLVIALGGGVVGDLAGYAAASYLRGVNFVQVPTSLLAQADSSVGGKVAVDLPRGKNLVGAFFQPKKVLIDPDALDTLEPRYYRDGMGEVIKHGCICDREFFEKLASGGIDREEMIYANCRIKAAFVERDERDAGERMKLNFGHTLGHAIEQYYDFKKYSHGEAVAIGMYNITKLAERKGLTKAGTAERIRMILEKYSLPYEFPETDRAAIAQAVSHDKKNLNGKLNLILIREIGESFIYSIMPEDFQDFFRGLTRGI